MKFFIISTIWTWFNHWVCLLGAYTNRVQVLIVPPAPFAAGTMKEYPHFVMDGNGKGILSFSE